MTLTAPGAKRKVKILCNAADNDYVREREPSEKRGRKMKRTKKLV